MAAQFTWHACAHIQLTTQREHPQLSYLQGAWEANGTQALSHLKVQNPIGHVSFVLPPGGCGTREKNSITDPNHYPGCKLAVIAGYFNVTHGGKKISPECELANTIQRTKTRVFDCDGWHVFQWQALAAELRIFHCGGLHQGPLSKRVSGAKAATNAASSNNTSQQQTDEQLITSYGFTAPSQRPSQPCATRNEWPATQQPLAITRVMSPTRATDPNMERFCGLRLPPRWR